VAVGEEALGFAVAGPDWVADGEGGLALVVAGVPPDGAAEVCALGTPPTAVQAASSAVKDKPDSVCDTPLLRIATCTRSDLVTALAR